MFDGPELRFGDDELIVSKTDPQGRITYANNVFVRVSGYTEEELLGQPHNIVRHPDMPRCVFKLLWDTIGAGQEVFAYVCNRARGGQHYWVLAHVTPNFDARGGIGGYHSCRRSPMASAIEQVAPVYRLLLEKERQYSDRKAGTEAGFAMLNEFLAQRGLSYEQFVLGL